MKVNRWLEDGVRPLVVAGMVGAMGLSVVRLAQVFFPAWNGMYLVLMLMLVTLEAHYSFRLVNAKGLRGSDALRFRVVELAVILIALRVVSVLAQGAAGLALAQSWLMDPVSIFFDFEMVAGFFGLLLAWGIGNQTALDLEVVDGPEAWQHEERSWEQMRQDALAYQAEHGNNRTAMENLSSRFWVGGALLLIVTGMSQPGFTEWFNLSAAPRQALRLTVLFYFLAGLMMLGLIRHTTLRRRWYVEQIDIAPDLSNRWISYTLTLVGLATLLAFLLPTAYSAGLLDYAAYMFGTITEIVIFIAMWLFFIISLPFLLLVWLYSSLFAEESLPLELSPPGMMPLQAAPPPGNSPEWYELLRTLLFWIVILGMFYFILRSYLQDHPELVTSLRKIKPIHVLRRWWRALWLRLRKWGRAAKAQLPGLISSRVSTLPSPKTLFPSLNTQSPRQKVLYYYRNILQRTAQQGIGRNQTQTPYEYDHTLEPKLPAAQEELAHLTDAFVEARYSQHDITSQEAEQAKKEWQRVKEALEERLKGESGVGSRESGIGNRKSGIGNRESGIGYRESGIGNRESGNR